MTNEPSPDAVPDLTPPWYTARLKILAAFVDQPGVSVGPLVTSGSPYTVTVTVENPEQARAMAAVLRPLWPMDEQHDVEVRVVDGAGDVAVPDVPVSAEELAGYVATALFGNPWFDGVFVDTPFGMHKAVFPVFKKAVIQFLNDDMTDLYRNFNGVAAQVFGEVLASAPGEIPIDPSTAPF